MKDIIGIKINASGVGVDLLVDKSDDFHIEDNIVFCKGWNKFKPQLGAEAGRYVKGANLNKLKTQVVRTLDADGIREKEVDIVEGKLIVNGSY
jgi:hypothetical protein